VPSGARSQPEPTGSPTAQVSRFSAKRLFDIIVATSAMLALAPILAIVALVVRLFLGSPILFRQTRLGYLERPFTIYKFRTMRHAVDTRGHPLPDGERLHPLGILLRKISIDELPQFWNLLKGDMSLVGPRPLLPEYLPRYTQQQRRRHEVKPGITGWAQVNGRNTLTWERKFELDVWYVDNWNLGVDIKIICLTLLKVIRREGIGQGCHPTMPKFSGSHESATEGF
jgi:sugar transferase EpsL